MLPALHSKLPHDTRSVLTVREDAVTATVFGMLRYLPWERGLGSILADLGLAGTAPGAIHFWPRHPGVEPDLMLVGSDWAVLIEAKVNADFGILQLGREWRLLREIGAGHRLRIVTVTPDQLPRGAARDLCLLDLEAMGDSGARPRPDEVHSLRWHDLLPTGQVFAPHEQALIDDLIAYLQVAGLLRAPFASFDGLEPPGLPPSSRWYHNAPHAPGRRWFALEPPAIPTSPHWYASP